MSHDPETYWSERAKEYGPVYVAGGNDRERWSDQLAAITPYLLDGIQGGRVLDFGCGPGRFQWAVEQVSDEYVGVDIIEGYGTEPLVDELPRGFDYALAIFVLQHIVDRKTYTHWITELYRCLKNGGKLFVVDHKTTHPGDDHMEPRGLNGITGRAPWQEVEVAGSYRSHYIAWLTK